MPRRWIVLSAMALALVAVQAAGGAPAPPVAAPSISGHPGYLETLTCERGSWGEDAASFSVTWHFSDTGDTLGQGDTYKVERRALSRYVICRVTATDAGGTSTTADSARVYIGPGRTTIKLKAKTPQVVTGAKVTLTGTVGPVESIAPDEGRTNRGRLVAYRVTSSGALAQLFGKYKLDAKTGKFSIVAPDRYGKNTYKVNYHANEQSLFASSTATRTVTLKRKKK